MLIKIILTILLILTVLVCVYFYFLSSTAQPPQSREDKTSLRPCPDKPNCVSSMAEKPEALIAAIDYSATDELAWKNMVTVMDHVGGTVAEQDNHYLRATFTSMIFRFVDDVEIIQDPSNKVFHIRSASRSGHSDLGVNRKRVEKIRLAFQSNK